MCGPGAGGSSGAGGREDRSLLGRPAAEKNPKTAATNTERALSFSITPQLSSTDLAPAISLAPDIFGSRRTAAPSMRSLLGRGGSGYSRELTM
jgi:hypothetical protein